MRARLGGGVLEASERPAHNERLEHMTGIMTTVWLAHDTGRASYTLRFPERRVIAYTSLSSYFITEGIDPNVYRQRYARSWIESRKTPPFGGNPDMDQRVHDTTDFLTFYLRVENASAAAVGVVFDTAPESGTGAGLLEPIEVIGRLLYDQTGGVRVVHREARFEGAQPIDTDAVNALLMARMGGPSHPELRIAEFDVNAFPSAVRLWVDPGTGEVSAVAG